MPATWPATVDAIVRGDPTSGPFAVLGRTPELLVKLGLIPSRLVMTCGKIAMCRRKHPTVSLSAWRKLPSLLADPLAVFPSQKDDGTLVVVLVVSDAEGDPLIVPIEPDCHGNQNVVLSVYAKSDGYRWMHEQVANHALLGSTLFKGKGFAATLPQPGFTEAIPSSPGPIPADGTTKPGRQILTLSQKVKDSDG